MEYEDLQNLYEEKKKEHNDDVYKYVSELLKEAKQKHKKDWDKSPTKNGDHEQSWRAFKGKNLEKLVQYIIKDEVKELGLTVINGNALERSKNLSQELSKVKRNLVINYGVYGMHLPDVDIIIYKKESCKVLAVLSCKVTLRERIAQTGYWKLKLLEDENTRHIKVYFITPDEDSTLTKKSPMKKGRAIVEADLDGSYVLTEEKVEESNKVKLFDKFIEDLKNLLK
ncbi:BsaWI family type II restriction enzyme [Thermodesulfobium sp. 4217-1]|uniref:BsaWI family type II restriction enzyme n=1 Tax=Thermodesulfobium sp. 4217-1 TaxID=3120013 RepID=UPI00322147F3